MGTQSGPHSHLRHGRHAYRLLSRFELAEESAPLQGIPDLPGGLHVPDRFFPGGVVLPAILGMSQQLKVGVLDGHGFSNERGEGLCDLAQIGCLHSSNSECTVDLVCPLDEFILALDDLPAHRLGDVHEGELPRRLQNGKVQGFGLFQDRTRDLLEEPARLEENGSEALGIELTNCALALLLGGPSVPRREEQFTATNPGDDLWDVDDMDPADLPVEAGMPGDDPHGPHDFQLQRFPDREAQVTPSPPFVNGRFVA